MRSFGIFNLIFALLLVAPVQARPTKNSSATSEKVYRQTLLDMGHDIEEFDGLSLSADERKKLAQNWKDFVENKTTTNPLNAYPELQALWPVKAIAQSTEKNLPPAHAEKITLEKINATAHSIQNVDEYASQRLGPSVANLLKSKQANLLVYGGDSTSLANDLKGHTLKRIPSLYEAWGVEKFVDVSPKLAKPTIIIRVPPIEQYVKHYAMVGNLVTGSNVKAELNALDRIHHHDEFVGEVGRLFQSFKTHPDYVVMGYAKNLREELTSGKSDWELESAPVKVPALPGDGISGTLFYAKNKANPEIKKVIFGIEAKQTIWGEGSEFLVDGILEQKPQEIVFLGSAGAPSKAANVYDVTVPKQFLAGDHAKIKIQNDLDRFRAETEKSKIVYGITHGNTNSPAEQSLDYVTKELKSGVDTIDVEENLIAKAILAYNEKHHAGIVFAAANVVTDKPSSQIYNWNEGNNLSQTNTGLKNQARESSVDAALTSLNERALWEKDADAERKKLILKTIPNLDPTKIYLTGGQGKIDADPKRKLSYYIFTENPRDPASPTHLIPMATSRFDTNNYQTDQWWDDHQDEIAKARAQGLPMPHQDRNEVRTYLHENGLSTNPDVYTINAFDHTASSSKLNDFLVKEYLERYSDGKLVTLYRGAEKAGELDAWLRKEVPRGVRYWTPDANYGWRYGRKKLDFLTTLVEGKAPLFKFNVPEDRFLELVRTRALVLGTELTKHAHDSFAATGKFIDQLNSQDYMGDGKYGLELEIRATRRARQEFPKYFVEAITVDDLADARIRQITDGTSRLALARPEESDDLWNKAKIRIERTEQERKVLKLLQTDCSQAEVDDAIAKLTPTTAEIANIDGTNLPAFAHKYREKCALDLKTIVPKVEP